MKWWLISDEDVKEIRHLLKATFQTEAGVQAARRQALYTFDTGLNVTDEVPIDFRREGESMDDYMRRHKLLKE